ncbi:tartrate dehydrogenase [Streptomyces caatingaensis]|uniref:D-malate dehydrogenase (decarboxylating) n=1 Tax=Streptomyces caatingaensis TaxID=1678637 RepID=A0A0K9XKF9_9ACTN|nr:tartrate dehydrogenase [Streptomyces caatingaensis]KNB53142.1 tartrate dehydrogenase [Streptomyces caatingaensis]
MTNHRIALVPGDGIGPEVLPPARQVLDAVGRRHGITFHYTSYDDWSCERHRREGAMMPEDGLDRLRDRDAILLGAVGHPDVPDHVSLWGLLIPIRRGFRQYVNLRPVRVFEGVDSPVRGARAGEVDLVVVRENTEGEYSRAGGRLHRGLPGEKAVQEAVFTRAGVTRVLDYAFGLAAARGGRVTSATKSNGLVHTMPFWDELVAERAAAHPGVPWEKEHIDALAAKFVLEPARYDVVVASNLFGDILSDLAAAVAGSIGIAPAANLNPERAFPSMFEPVHGSAPDIAGRGIANPLGAIGAAALMLDHLGHPAAAKDVTDAVAAVLATSDVRTPDLGGSATTGQFTEKLLTLL